MYIYRGIHHIHMELTNPSLVRKGQTGRVLVGSSDTSLEGGAFEITRVAGKYAIATTRLTQLGRNRRVCINAR